MANRVGKVNVAGEEESVMAIEESVNSKVWNICVETESPESY